MKLDSIKLLQCIIKLLTQYLAELSDVSDRPDSQFAYGEKTAYTECLEFLSYWDEAEQNGLDFEVEKRFPLV